MDSSLTESEKRFILAEMIKESQIEIDLLAHFVRLHRVEPDWMKIQLPPRRNMNHCKEIAEQLSISPPHIKRKASFDSSPHYSKKKLTSPFQEQVSPLAHQEHQYHAIPPSHGPSVPLLPRPNLGVAQSPPVQSAPAGPKKRGRPSRADKAKRDLKPNLPPHIAPRPPSISHVLNGPAGFGLAAQSPTQPSHYPPTTPPAVYKTGRATQEMTDDAMRRRLSHDASRPTSAHVESGSESSSQAQAPREGYRQSPESRNGSVDNSKSLEPYSLAASMAPNHRASTVSTTLAPMLEPPQRPGGSIPPGHPARLAYTV